MGGNGIWGWEWTNLGWIVKRSEDKLGIILKKLLWWIGKKHERRVEKKGMTARRPSLKKALKIDAIPDGTMSENMT